MGNFTGVRFGVATAAVVAVVAVAGCGSSATADGPQVPQEAPTQQEVAALFGDWNRALATLDPQRVADHYAPDAVLLPTVSNQVRTDRAGIVDYFQHFLENKPQGAILRSQVKMLGPDDAIDTGTYRFTLTKDGVQSTVDARYTYVYERINGKWLIVNHHSSAMPEKS